MNVIQTLYKFALMLTAFFSLTGCGGGSSPTPCAAPTSYRISGSISGGTGTTVVVSGQTAITSTTNAAGDYSIVGLPSGSYTVTPIQPGFTFTPISRSVSITSTDVGAMNFTRNTPTDSLPANVISRIDGLPDQTVLDADILLPNGQPLYSYLKFRGISIQLGASGDSPRILSVPQTSAINLPPAVDSEQKKSDLVAVMLSVARQYACGRDPSPCSRWDYPADSTDPILRPAQQGLVYIWGGKAPLTRVQPTDGCPEQLYGVDCSGYIFNVAAAAGITIPQGTAATQSAPESWPLPADWQLAMKLVIDQKIEPGDIVGFKGHIGIALTGGVGIDPVILSSLGLPGECEKNRKPKSGPRALSLSKLRLTPIAVLRLVSTTTQWPSAPD